MKVDLQKDGRGRPKPCMQPQYSGIYTCIYIYIYIYIASTHACTMYIHNKSMHDTYMYVMTLLGVGKEFDCFCTSTDPKIVT